jgi:hypothetical protein
MFAMRELPRKVSGTEIISDELIAEIELGIKGG